MNAYLERINAHKLSLTVHFCVAALFFASGGLTSASTTCDPRLQIRTDKEIFYQPRGDRCEGQYAQLVSSTILFVLGLQDEPLNGSAPDHFVVAWPRSAFPTTLRVRTQNPDTYYQMDATLPARVTKFQWPANIPQLMNVTPPDIIAMATIEDNFDGKQRAVMLPVSRASQLVHGRLVLYVIPGVQLDQLSYSLYKYDKANHRWSPYGKPTVLPDGSYAIVDPARIVLPGQLPIGAYFLQLDGVLSDGNKVSRPVWFETEPP
jgi:hypothetical protein